MEEINKVLGNFWALEITDFKYDFFNAEIVIRLAADKDEDVLEHELRFINCASFTWLGRSEDSYGDDFERYIYCELTSINIGIIGAESRERWLEHYPMKYNVSAEIGVSALLINAVEIVIDGQHYLLPKC